MSDALPAADGPKVDPVKWREVYSTNPGDYYADTIEAGDGGELRVSAGGKVVQKANIRSLLSALWPDTPPVSRPPSALPLTKYRPSEDVLLYGDGEDAGTVFRPLDAVYLASDVDKLLAETGSLRTDLERQRDEARQIVADINNEVIGSHGYFTKPSCVTAVQELKEQANREWRKRTEAEAELTALRTKLAEAETAWYAREDAWTRKFLAYHDAVKAISPDVAEKADLRAALTREEPADGR